MSKVWIKRIRHIRRVLCVRSKIAEANKES